MGTKTEGCEEGSDGFSVATRAAGRYVLHDRDTKFCKDFRQTLAAGAVDCVPLPARSPNLNSYAERWVRSVKSECLSKLILFGESSLRRALTNSCEHTRQAFAIFQRDESQPVFPVASSRSQAIAVPDELRDRYRHNHFSAQVDAIERMILSGKSSIPIPALTHVCEDHVARHAARTGSPHRNTPLAHLVRLLTRLTSARQPLEFVATAERLCAVLQRSVEPTSFAIQLPARMLSSWTRDSHGKSESEE